MNTQMCTCPRHVYTCMCIHAPYKSSRMRHNKYVARNHVSEKTMCWGSNALGEGPSRVIFFHSVKNIMQNWKKSKGYFGQIKTHRTSCQRISHTGNVKGNPSRRRKMLPDGTLHLCKVTEGLGSVMLRGRRRWDSR